MRKSYLFAGLLSFSMLLVGCKEDAETPGGDPGLEGTMEELAPNAQKTRLQDVGLEFIGAVKAEHHENLMDVSAYVDDEYGYYDIDEDYIDKLDALYDDYVGTRANNPVLAIRDLMAVSLDVAQCGAKLASSTERIYTTVLRAGLKDLYGGFKPDEKDEVWAYDKNITDRLEVEFTDDHNQKWVATLKGSKETTRVHVTVYDKNVSKDVYEDGPDAGLSSEEIWIYDDEYTLDVPKQITFTVNCNGNAIVNMTVNSDLAFDWVYNEESVSTDYLHWYEYEWSDEGGWYNSYGWDWTGSYSVDIDYTNLNVDAKLNVNGYEETFKSNATKEGISASASVKINGKSMLVSEAALNADIESIIKQVNDAAKEDDEEDIKVDASAVKDFSMYIDLMGKVQIVGKCDKFEDLYDAIVDLEKADDEDNFNKYERNLNQVNSAYRVTLHYDKTETVQADIELEAYEVESGWDGSYTYFEVRPILIFAVDDSRYSFEDYFTESSFSELIEAVEDLADDFDNMFERYF